MIVRYALKHRIAGFDFFAWLVCQKAAGATEVVLDPTGAKTDKFALSQVMRRFESIIVPGVALMGLPSRIGQDGGEVPGAQQDLLALAKLGPIPRLKSVLPPGKERYTVTLRNFERWPHRNSKKKDWRTFADEIGARVIPDYEDKPIHLHERMALYAGAEMNFFVTNGPVILCFLSEYPAMSFDVQQSPMIPIGIPMGGQYPFLRENKHRQIYEPGELSVIRKHFYHWRDTGTFL